jgi:hypothetical protein
MAEDLQSTESEIAEIYVATFGRAPDKAGLAYWTQEVLKGNLSVEQVTESFFDQKETQDMYADMDDTNFIISVYKNTLGQDVDENDEGVQYWLEGFENGFLSRDVFVKTLINGAKAETGNPLDAQLLQNKVNAGLFYAKEVGVEGSEFATELMSGITYDDTTAEEAMGLVSFYSGWVDKYSGSMGEDGNITEEDMWKNIHNDDFWAELTSENAFEFEGIENANFWESDDEFWMRDPEVPYQDFGFIDQEDLWAVDDAFLKFSGGEYRGFDDKMIFQQYASESANMYNDMIQNDMDPELMTAMFGDMDEDLYNEVFDDMFGGYEDDFFYEMYQGEDGELDEDMMAGMEGHMFNHMFDDYASGDNYGQYFGGFEDDFFFEMYKGEDGELDQGMMAGMEGGMFNNMFDDYASGDNYEQYFGGFEDDFFYDMYKGEDGELDEGMLGGMQGDMFDHMFDDYASGDNFEQYFGDFEGDLFVDGEFQPIYDEPIYFDDDFIDGEFEDGEEPIYYDEFEDGEEPIYFEPVEDGEEPIYVDDGGDVPPPPPPPAEEPVEIA